MKKDLKDTSFILPVKIESEDRLRNVITVCCFLLENFDTTVILKEVDAESVFQKEALAQISEYVEDGIDILTLFCGEYSNIFVPRTSYFYNDIKSDFNNFIYCFSLYVKILFFRRFRNILLNIIIFLFF